MYERQNVSSLGDTLFIAFEMFLLAWLTKITEIKSKKSSLTQK